MTERKDRPRIALPSAASAGGTGVYSTISYLPYGGLKSWMAHNNVVTTIGQATNLLPRPSSISTAGATTNFSSGAYSTAPAEVCSSPR